MRARFHMVTNVRTSRISTEVPWSWATVCREKPNLLACGSPPCGPVEVTTVPSVTTMMVAASCSRASSRDDLLTSGTLRARGLLVGHGRPPVEQDGVDEEYQAEQEVGHHQARGQVRLDHQGAEAHLGQEAHYQSARQQGQVAAAAAPAARLPRRRPGRPP